MKSVPDSIATSVLWSVLSRDHELTSALVQMRANAAAVGAKVAEAIPGYTDHSVSHMDALWQIADVVLSADEVSAFTTGEAFILASAFYVHDLGMAFAATPEGRAVLEQSSAYRSCVERLSNTAGCAAAKAHAIALQVSARDMHAKHAERLIDTALPGLDRHLLESTQMRQQWGNHIGSVAASHHWNLQELDSKLGGGGRVPAPSGPPIDLGYVACALRVIDYAHINAARAPQLDRLLRSDMPDESLVHWLAQEFISGPSREGQYLAYASMRPIHDVDAWWVFYEMASGLDREITAVADYLSARTVSADRFSLEGVKGVKSPTAFAKLVRPGEFSPVDIRFRPDSMTRLVDLLGGRQLYGNDRFAPLRELLQNARDAIHLQRAVEVASDQSPRLGQIEVKLEASESGARLAISDDGVGMSAKTVTTYLLGIASDFWQSPDFYGEYPGVRKLGFSPVGRFGIGFLSVFMLGEDVEVETQRLAGTNLTLRLRGVGKRGALEERPSALRTGTTVRVAIPSSRQTDLEGLARILQAKAPMLDVRVRVTEMDNVVRIEPGWWRVVSQDELTDFLYQREDTATYPIRVQRRRAHLTHGYEAFVRRGLLLRETPVMAKWPGNQPEITTDAFRVVAIAGSGRVTVCSKGFALSDISVRGISGLAEVGEVEVNAARSLPIGFDEDAFRNEMLAALWPAIVVATDNLIAEGSIPARFSFLHTLASVFGRRILAETTLPWIGIQERAGGTVLVSSGRLVELLKTTDEVFVAYATGPWGADHWLRTFYPDAGSSYLLVVVSSWGGPSIRTRYAEETTRIDTSLAEHFVPDHMRDVGESQLSQAQLLLATLECVATAWHTTVSALSDTPWSRTKGNIMGRLRRE